MRLSSIFTILGLGAATCGLAVHKADAATYTVLNANDAGAGSLRQAILDSNASAGADTIGFVRESCLVTLSSPLPEVTGKVFFNGIMPNMGFETVILARRGTTAFPILSIGAGADVDIYNIDLTGGGTPIGGNYDGGLLVNRGRLLLRNGRLSQSTARSG
ncbi:hypothetical protein EON80_24450, partial [bacterium]